MEEIVNSLNVGVGTGLAVLGSKEILDKLLGPSADYIGNETKNLIAKCNINLGFRQK
ncbi:hypothetical protein QLH52_13575 [Methylomonas sp. OY6]|uniref:Uncharacterized protein n=1 Tax=Methylomonas defluvii TaxID=3045149 RepID=A0ABU4UGL2_9GAMM|nr:hypothetical protein [Methylomonas sp. OY6]MDX8128321.1 hypothetical protein [Methylomonas sp. OY6]